MLKGAFVNLSSSLETFIGFGPSSQIIIIDGVEIDAKLTNYEFHSFFTECAVKVLTLPTGSGPRVNEMTDRIR